MRLALALAALLASSPAGAEVVPLKKTDLCDGSNYRYSAISKWLKDVTNTGGGGATAFHATSDVEFVVEGQVSNGRQTATEYQCLDYKISAIQGNIPSENACCYPTFGQP